MATPTTDTPISPLRQRMHDDMLMRGLGAHTQQDYIRHVRRFAAFLGRSPDTATTEDIRRFQLYQHENGIGPATINGAVSVLRFLFTVTLRRRDLASALVVTRYPRRSCRNFRLARTVSFKVACDLPHSRRRRENVETHRVGGRRSGFARPFR